MSNCILDAKELSLNERLADVGATHAFVYVLLKTHADDQGRLDVTRRRELKANIAPMFDELTHAVIGEAIVALESVGLVQVYEVNGGEYLQLLCWHNTRRWRYPSNYPAPPGWIDDVNCRRGQGQEEENKPTEDDEEAPYASGRECPPPSDNVSHCPIGEGVGIGDGVGVGNRGKGALAPPGPLKRRSKRKTDPPEPKPRPPAADVYHDVVKRYPHSSLWDRLAQVTDLDRWRRVVSAYIACGWNPNNVGAMLDWYNRSEIPNTGRRRKLPRAGLIDEEAYNAEVHAALVQRGLAKEEEA